MRSSIVAQFLYRNSTGHLGSAQSIEVNLCGTVCGTHITLLMPKLSKHHVRLNNTPIKTGSLPVQCPDGISSQAKLAQSERRACLVLSLGPNCTRRYTAQARSQVPMRCNTWQFSKPSFKKGFWYESVLNALEPARPCSQLL